MQKVLTLCTFLCFVQFFYSCFLMINLWTETFRSFVLCNIYLREKLRAFFVWILIWLSTVHGLSNKTVCLIICRYMSRINWEGYRRKEDLDYLKKILTFSMSVSKRESNYQLSGRRFKYGTRKSHGKLICTKACTYEYRLSLQRRWCLKFCKNTRLKFEIFITHVLIRGILRTKVGCKTESLVCPASFKFTVYWNALCSFVSVNYCLWELYCLLKRRAAAFSEIFIFVYKTTEPHIPGDCNLDI